MNPARRIEIWALFLTPQPLRTVAIDPETTVGDLCLIINAALGLAPSPPGRFENEDRIIEAMEVLDQLALPLIFADENASYEPSVGEWKILLTKGPYVEPEQKLPALLRCSGPDLVSEIGSPRGTVQIMNNVLNILSGRPVSADAAARIAEIFPNYSIDQVESRLTDCFAPQIIQRLAELSSTDLTHALDADLPAPFANPSPFELEPEPLSLTDAIPELAPDFELPRLNPGQRLEIGKRLAEILSLVREYDKLTASGYFKPDLVNQLLDIMPFEKLYRVPRPREIDNFPIEVIHGLLNVTGLIRETSTKIELTEKGEEVIAIPSLGAGIVAETLPLMESGDEFLPILFMLVKIIRGDKDIRRYLEDMLYQGWVANRAVLVIFGGMDDDTSEANDLGKALLGETIAHYRAFFSEEPGNPYNFGHEK
ncbi:hypothetical protein CPHO_11975 [Corynebacterium phocae]|uniref:Uncharacterized protein n=1 Tax=Corynebacterium phocae TaxID=161895 RepID=A0A1L7D5R9_9CORY|nr:hypothetical protein [Corynebacterium phocae]APT93489.1 hypothetical protein CPHO_11975 [Corynebacterium phocae]KAA8720568.1 hypothetical protein F4V58_11425 [Corynebacterium phocae]